MKENQREKSIDLILSKSAEKSNNGIYSLSEKREVIKGAYGTQQFISEKTSAKALDACLMYFRATYMNQKSQEIEKYINLTLLTLAWRTKKSNGYNLTISDEGTHFYPAVFMCLKPAQIMQ